MAMWIVGNLGSDSAIIRPFETFPKSRKRFLDSLQERIRRFVRNTVPIFQIR